jgi:hypothetical protein
VTRRCCPIRVPTTSANDGWASASKAIASWSGTNEGASPIGHPWLIRAHGDSVPTREPHRAISAVPAVAMTFDPRAGLIDRHPN